jgi:RNA polymerase sigma-70 factor (ECF subfamily)
MSGRHSARHLPIAATSPDSETHSSGPSSPTFIAVYYRYFDFVWSSVKYLGIGADAIDDIVQEVFMIVHAKLHTRQYPEALRSWIYGVVRRTVSTHRRSTRARTGLEARWEESHATPPPTPLELTERAAQIELLASLLSELDKPKREILVAAELEEMSVAEIAEALEIPLNTAYSRLRAARQAFEKRLTRRLGREKKGDRSK